MRQAKGWVAAAALTVGACASAPNPSSSANADRRGASEIGRELADAQGRVPRPLAPFVAADRAEGPRNAVLNAMLAGKAALDLGAPAQARALLDLAYQRIEVIYADNPAAREARSKFVPEARKDFKGEPYERAMVGYYLGMADLLLGDLDNARNAFRWGEFQDTLSATEQYQGDMASLQFLMGWVSHCQGRVQDAREALALARKTRPGLPDLNLGDNVLAVVEAGPAPTKVRAGQHGEALAYAPAAMPDENAEVALDLGSGPGLRATLAESLQWQATTLGGRQIDHILAGKASFKEGATRVAEAGRTTALVGAEVLRAGANLGDRQTANVGGVLALGGLLTSMVSGALASATRAEADTRSWHNLPGALFIAVGRVAPEQAATARVAGRGPALWGAAPAAAPLAPVPGTACHVARLRPGAAATEWSATQPGAWLTLAEAERAALPQRPGAEIAGPTGTRPPRTADVPEAPPARTAPVRASF